MKTPLPEPNTASFARFLRQEIVIRDAMESGIERGLDTPDDHSPSWDERIRFQIEVACIRIVDNFLSYVSEILQLSIAKRPDMLRSKETITIEEAMRFSRHKDLVSFLTDRTISRLAYKSFDDINKYIEEKTNIFVIETEEEKTLLMVSIELRNIYTHNRGEASDVTFKRLESFDHPLEMQQGELVETSLDLLEELIANITLIARRLDKEFSKKFGLRRTR